VTTAFPNGKAVFHGRCVLCTVQYFLLADALAAVYGDLNAEFLLVWLTNIAIHSIIRSAFMTKS